MFAKDVMTRQVHTLPATASIFEAVQLLLSSHVSAVPVVDGDGRLVGIVSEADLVHRVELGTEHRRSWLLRMLRDDTAAAADYIKSHARRVADIMTTKVHTAREDAPLAEIARLMDEHHVKRVPIVHDGKPVGIVSRANLLQGLMAFRPSPTAPQATDQDLRDAVMVELAKYHWPSTWPMNVVVENGVVHLWGYAPSATAKNACRVAAEGIAGVKAVENHLAVLPESVAFGV
ncbi:MAG: CBS domain-containing protein [Alphaproteobacteria bacterium]|nr:CBS domain-containing protein [Alphaproteobacteria bacterium]